MATKQELNFEYADTDSVASYNIKGAINTLDAHIYTLENRVERQGLYLKDLRHKISVMRCYIAILTVANIVLGIVLSLACI